MCRVDSQKLKVKIFFNNEKFQFLDGQEQTAPERNWKVFAMLI